MADTPDYGEPRRTIRISDELWNAMLVATAENGETVAAVTRRAYQSYVSRWWRAHHKGEKGPQWNQRRRGT